MVWLLAPQSAGLEAEIATAAFFEADKSMWCAEQGAYPPQIKQSRRTVSTHRISGA